MKRNLGIGIAIAALLCAALIYLGRGAEREREAHSPASSGVDERVAFDSPAAAGPVSPEVSAPTETVPAEPPAADLPPALLTGVVLGEGTGVPDAKVMLFSARRVEGLIEELEARITALAGGGTPDIPEILRTVRGELEAFRRSAVIAETDLEGRFEVRGIPEGGYFLLTYAPRWLFRYGDVVALAEGRTEEIELPLERGAAIAGRVVRGSGEGIEGIHVIAEFAPPSTTGIGPLVRKALQYVNGEFLKGPFEVLSGADGAFEIASLPPGNYNVTAYDDKGLESTVQGISTGTTGVLVLFGEPATLTGVLASPQGFPLAGIALELERIDLVVNLPIPGAAEFVSIAERLLGEGPREAETAADGGFAFRDLGAGRYRLAVHTPGLNPHQQEVRLEWGEAQHLGEIRIDPGRKITGFVRAASGVPLAGAAVQAVQQGGNFMNGAGIMRDVMSGRLRVETGADGGFEIYGLRPMAEYEVTASAEGYAPAERIAKADGEPVEFALVPGRSLAGIVVRSDTGEGIAGATVRAGAVGAESDAAGRFTLEGVIPSVSASVSIGTQGSGMESEIGGADVDIQARAPGFLRGEQTIDLDRLPAEVQVTLEPLVAIDGIVLAPTGEPMPGALVRLIPEVPDDMGPFHFDTSMIFFAVAAADSEGRFSLERYFADPDLRFQVIADRPGYTRGASAGFSVAEIPTISPVTVRLRAASTIHGTVSDGSAPVAGAVVRLTRPTEGTDPQESAMLQLLGLPKGGEVVHSDSTGRFRFEAHEPGEFTIGAEMVDFSDSPTERFTLAEGASVEFHLVLDPGSSLSGVVTDEFGAPLASAIVRVLQEGGDIEADAFQAQLILGGAFRSARTADDGSYALSGLPAGGYTVVAEKRGYAKALADALWINGPSVRNFALVPCAALRGKVVDTATGRPIPDFAVSVTPKEREFEWGPGLESVSSSDGIFERAELEPGGYEIEVRSAGFGSSTLEVDLRPGTLAEPVISLERAARLRGVVRDAASGDPVAGARVALARPRDSEALSDEETMREFIREAMLGDSVETDAEGRFLLDSVPAGTPTIVVNHEQYVQLRQAGPTVRRGEEAEVDLALSHGRSVSGLVRTPSGAPAGVRFLILSGDDDATRGVRKNTVSAEGGEYTFSGLEPGAYRIFAAGRSPQGTRIEVAGSDLTGIEVIAEEQE